jgi:hypothetical protein
MLPAEKVDVGNDSRDESSFDFSVFDYGVVSVGMGDVSLIHEVLLDTLPSTSVSIE